MPGRAPGEAPKQWGSQPLAGGQAQGDLFSPAQERAQAVGARPAERRASASMQPQTNALSQSCSAIPTVGAASGHALVVSPARIASMARPTFAHWNARSSSARWSMSPSSRARRIEATALAGTSATSPEATASSTQ